MLKGFAADRVLPALFRLLAQAQTDPWLRGISNADEYHYA